MGAGVGKGRECAEKKSSKKVPWGAKHEKRVEKHWFKHKNLKTTDKDNNT